MPEIPYREDDNGEQLFTVAEFRNYLMKADSMGDAVHFLNASRIEEANEMEDDLEFEDEDEDDLY